MRVSNFVESYFDAWNLRDPEAVADHLSCDGIYRDIPENSQRTHDELIGSLARFFRHHHHHYELVGDILKQGDTLAFQYRMSPAGRGRKNVNGTSYRGAEFMTLKGESAISIIDYYDMPLGGRSRKYAKSGLTGAQLADYKERLERIMVQQQGFLQPDLTLPQLAGEVDCSVNHLSQVINSGFGMSFFDYLNSYRVEFAKQLLAEPAGQSGAILGIAFTSGFNSNSAFYAAFKKFVGRTPAQYRRDQANRDD